MAFSGRGVIVEKLLSVSGILWQRLRRGLEVFTLAMVLTLAMAFTLAMALANGSEQVADAHREGGGTNAGPKRWYYFITQCNSTHTVGQKYT
jgi:hypothetical protein